MCCVCITFITFFLFGFFNSLLCCCKSFFLKFMTSRFCCFISLFFVTLLSWNLNPAKQRFFVASANFKCCFCSRWLIKLLIRNRLIWLNRLICSKPVDQIYLSRLGSEWSRKAISPMFSQTDSNCFWSPHLEYKQEVFCIGFNTGTRLFLFTNTSMNLKRILV